MEKRNKAQSNQGKANLAALSKRDRSVNEDLNNLTIMTTTASYNKTAREAYTDSLGKGKVLNKY